MKKYFLLTSAMTVLVGLLSSSCSSDDDFLPQHETASATFHISMDAQTRAAEELDLDKYAAKMYLFEKEAGSTADYTFVSEKELEKAESGKTELTIPDLDANKEYKAVFLARRSGQTPALPTLTESRPAYKAAVAQYINAQDAEDEKTGKGIFRSIVSFKPDHDNTSYHTVLTRQNGALEVRIKNMTDMTAVKLHIMGHTAMLLQDGTGGEVITYGDAIELSKTITEGLSAPEVRIRINVLPQEDVKAGEGKDNYLEITTVDGGTKKYPIKSDQWRIPIFPNQVTWLTLSKDNKNDDGDDDDDDDKFDAEFGNFDDGINMKNEWDGWYEGSNNQNEEEN